MAMVERTPPSGIQALKRTVFISHGENARRIGRTRREPALSGALSAERTPHFARSFCLLQNVGKMYGLLGGEKGFEPSKPLIAQQAAEFSLVLRSADGEPDLLSTGRGNGRAAEPT